jgi:hypothetical protein
MTEYPIRAYRDHTDQELDEAPRFNGYTFFEAFGLAQEGRLRGAPPAMEELARFLTNTEGRDRMSENDWAMLADYFLQKQGRWGRARGSKQCQPRVRRERELALHSLAYAAKECRDQVRSLTGKKRIREAPTVRIIEKMLEAFVQNVPCRLGITTRDVFELVWKNRSLAVTEESLALFVPNRHQNIEHVAAAISSEINSSAYRHRDTGERMSCNWVAPKNRSTRDATNSPCRSTPGGSPSAYRPR